MAVSDPINAASTILIPRHLPGYFLYNIRMTGYRKFQGLSKSDAAYIAGLIDGEATLTLTRKHKNENRQLCVSISSTERPLLEYVLSITGVGKITNKSVSKSHHAKSFTFAVYNRQALALLEQTLPFLKSYKRDRAELILRDYLTVTPRNGKYSAKLLAQKEEFENSVLSIKANN